MLGMKSIDSTSEEISALSLEAEPSLTTVVGVASPVLNAFDLDVIAEKVLDYTDRQTNITCRGLNRLWSENAVKALRTRGVLLQLDSDNILEYLRLVKATDQTWPSLNLGINVKRSDFSCNKVGALLVQVNELHERFSRDGATAVQFVESLSCTALGDISTSTWESLVALIRLVGPGLRSLYLRLHTGHARILRLPFVELPELRHLFYVDDVADSLLLSDVKKAAPQLARVEQVPMERSLQSWLGLFNSKSVYAHAFQRR